MLVIIYRAMPVMIDEELCQGMAKLAKSLFQFSKLILPEPSLGNNKEGMFVKTFLANASWGRFSYSRFHYCETWLQDSPTNNPISPVTSAIF